ncbi:winged helix-turn-helix domain-containing protein [bacterium]|nr:winged helix-turn-helix domain-containing protein [bacterium]
MSLLSYCITERQRNVITLHEEGLGYQRIGDKLGMTKWGVRDIVKNVKGKAAIQGHSPAHDMVRTVPEGFNVKGVSTYYNDEGKPVGQWVKSVSDKEAQFKMMIERIELACEGIKPWKPVKKSKVTEDDLLSLLVITDFHLGSYCWGEETSEDYDTNMARDLFLSSIKDMIDSTPQSKIGMLCNLGDFLHWDGLEQLTPSGKNLLEGDSRYSRIVDIAMTVMDEAVRMMLKKYEKVVFVCAEGNHDIAGSIWLRKFIRKLYAKEPRLEVIDNDFPYYAYRHGDTMLCFHHGHKAKMGSLPKVFSSEPRFREDWGRSKIAYIHSGHYHHERLLEDAGAITEQHPTLASRDSYATRLGLMSQRGAKVITYDAKDGEVSRITVRPR